MPQSQSVFAVSLQEHPELLKKIMPLLRRKVNSYIAQTIIIVSKNILGSKTFWGQVHTVGLLHKLLLLHFHRGAALSYAP